MKVQAGRQTKQQAAELLRQSLVHAMRSGNILAINLGDLDIDFNAYIDEGIFPTQQIFDFEGGRDVDTYIKWVKEDEKHGYDGKVNGVFQMNKEFTICIVTTNTDPETANKIASKLAHHEKMHKFVIEP